MLDALLEYSYPVRLLFYFLGNLFLIAWAKWIVLKARAGFTRLILALPILLSSVCLPHLFILDNPNETSVATMANAIFVWIVPFRILGLCMNRGQATKAQTSSFVAFSVAFVLPINVAFSEIAVDVKKKNDSDAPLERKKSSLQPYKDVSFSVVTCSGTHRLKEIFKVLLICLVKFPLNVAGAFAWKHLTHYPVLRSEVQAWWLFFFVSFFENFNELMSLVIFGVKLSPSFDQPYLSSSLSEFWGKRWNRVIQVVLSDTIYDPILQNRLNTDGQYYYKGAIPIYRRMIGAVCVFVVSGLAHVWLLSFLADIKTFPVFYFLAFAVNGIIVALEKVLKHFISCSTFWSSIVRKIPKLAFILLTHVILVTIAHLVMFPEFNASGFPEKCADGCVSILG